MSADWATIIVAVIGIAVAWVSGRSAKAVSKTTAETDAYTRARSFDLDIIKRQKEELDEERKEKAILETENEFYKKRDSTQQRQIDILRRQLGRLQENPEERYD